MDVRRRLAQLTSRLGEVVSVGRRPQRHPPGVLDTREEPLGEHEVTPNPLAGHGSAHSPATEPTVCGTWVEPASVSADWTTTSGFSPGGENGTPWR